MPGPLEGYLVIDLTEGDGAPFAAMQLGDAGADVIKVEPLAGDWARPHGPPFDHGDGPLFLGLNRNKRSLAVDLETETGRDIVRTLAQRADVFIESFPKADDAARLGLDYTTLSAGHPELVYCDISMTGRVGPERDRAETDLTLQGRSAIARFTGVRGEAPVRWGTNYTGTQAGMYAAAGILAALYWRKASGLGQMVSTSNLRAMIATQQNTLTATSRPDLGIGFAGTHLQPPARGMATKDGRIETSISQAGRDPHQRPAIIEAFGLRQKWQTSPLNNGQALEAVDITTFLALFQEALLDWTTEDSLQILERLNIRNAPWHNLETMFRDPGVVEQNVLLEADHPLRGRLKTPGLAWDLTATPGGVRLAPPLLGEHSTEILGVLGYSSAQIAELIDGGYCQAGLNQADTIALTLLTAG